VNFTALELADALSVSVNHDASLIVNANYSVMQYGEPPSFHACVRV
jgi:hypothetical protein